MAKSFLEENIGGIYTPGLRFAFTNITEEDFTTHWSKIPVIVKPGETIEVSDATPLPGAGMGQTLAIKMTGELVDKIMISDIKVKETEFFKANPGSMPNTFRAPNNMGVPAARKPFEDLILRQLSVDEESPAMQMLKKQVLEDIQAGIDGRAEEVAIPTSVEEFAEIKKPTIEAPKKAAKTKKI